LSLCSSNILIRWSCSCLMYSCWSCNSWNFFCMSSELACCCNGCCCCCWCCCPNVTADERYDEPDVGDINESKLDEVEADVETGVSTGADGAKDDMSINDPRLRASINDCCCCCCWFGIAIDDDDMDDETIGMLEADEYHI
jgi:hypothetical protein